MNLKCTNNDKMHNALTVGKEYEILGGEGALGNRRFVIRDDQHFVILVEAERFEKIPPPC